MYRYIMLGYPGADSRDKWCWRKFTRTNVCSCKLSLALLSPVWLPPALTICSWVCEMCPWTLFFVMLKSLKWKIVNTVSIKKLRKKPGKKWQGIMSITCTINQHCIFIRVFDSEWGTLVTYCWLTITGICHCGGVVFRVIQKLGIKSWQVFSLVL